MVAHEAALRRMWKDTCTVTIQQSSTDPATKITSFTEVVLFENEPCKLSFKAFAVAGGNPVATATQQAKLILSAERQVPAGSKIEVTRRGRTLVYSRSGEAGVFSHHQELLLEKFRRWA